MIRRAAFYLKIQFVMYVFIFWRVISYGISLSCKISKHYSNKKWNNVACYKLFWNCLIFIKWHQIQNWYKYKIHRLNRSRLKTFPKLIFRAELEERPTSTINRAAREYFYPFSTRHPFSLVWFKYVKINLERLSAYKLKLKLSYLQ